MNISKAQFNQIMRVSIAVIALVTIPVRGFAGSKRPLPGIVQDRAEADATGDGVTDTILLMGYESELGGPFCHSHEVVIIDGSTEKEITLALGDRSAGYPGSLVTCDLNEDHSSEILVSIPTGGSGGITNFFVVSALNGEARLLVDPEELAHGPELEIRSLDHFTIEVVDTERNSSSLVGLSEPDKSDESSPYSEFYSESGMLLKALDIWVDDVGDAELVHVDDKNGRCELVTYQKICAIYHANSVGMVRTTWRYADGELRIASVEVTPYLIPEAYTTYLESIDHSDPANAVKQAIDDYKIRFKQAPPAFREQAFAEFRRLHLAIARTETESLERAAGIPDAKNSDDILAAYARLPEIAASRKASHAYKEAGLTPVYAGEGLWTVEPRPGFYTEQFGTMLPDSVVDFLELDETERNTPWLVDGALVVPVEELGRRTAAWEAYLESNPYSLFGDEAKLRFNRAISALLLGTDNTPHCNNNTGLVRPEVLKALSAHAEAYPDTRSGKAAEKVVQILKKTTSAADDDGMKEIRRIVEGSMYPMEHAQGSNA